ncbi:MAG: phosphoribosylanthranilate isomerase [Caldilineales bacterium]
MLVQVFAIKSVEEMQMCIDVGLDRWGLEVGKKGIMPSEMSFEKTRQVFKATPARYPKMALTIETDLDELVEIVTETKPDLFHLCGDIADLSPEGVFELRKRIPGVEIIQAIPVTGPESLAIALAYEEVADVLFLDSVAPNVKGIGIAGVTHDWNISRKIVETVKKPCVLAGGLTPENVAASVRAVRPWGVDSNTHTCIPGTWKKDFDRMRRFAEAAKGALQE